ncbi:hypothetical protein [Nonomuraea sp. NPDC050310]|uniref:hypothetical protein n=1 Tax=unclassified Nonomuraea TaxID=2593643 RepID=UPI0033F5A915
MTEPDGGTTPKRPVAVPVVALLAATALGITALFGGLAEVPTDPPAKLAEGAKVDQVRFETEFLGARSVLQKAPNEFAEDHRYLDVLVKVTNKTDSTEYVGKPWVSESTRGSGWGESVRLMEPQGLTDVMAYVDNPERTSQLFPDVPATVVVRYELDVAAQPPAQVALKVAAFEEAEDEFDGHAYWDLAGEQVTKPDPLTVEGLTAPLTGDGRPQMYNMVSSVATVTLKVKQEVQQ